MMGRIGPSFTDEVGHGAAREIGKLSAVAVRGKSTPGLYADGGGLYLQVTEAGAKTWIYRFMLKGRRRDMGLGALHTVSLAEAREEARRCRQLVRDGLDPIDSRKEARLAARAATAKVMTFKQCAEAYLKAHEAGWQNAKHAAQWSSTLDRYAYPVMGELSVAAVDTGLVMKALEPIWSTKTETASRVRGRIEAILDWAIVRKYREGENPARWKGHLDHLLPARAKVQKAGHHAALPYDQMADFMTTLRAMDGTAARALEFAILTAARTGENGSECSERTRRTGVQRRQSRQAPVQHGPADDPAADEAHRPHRPRLPLHLPRLGGRMHRLPPRSRRNGSGPCCGDKVEAAYRRGDLFEKRRKLMDEWAKYCVARSGANLGQARGE